MEVANKSTRWILIFMAKVSHGYEYRVTRTCATRYKILSSSRLVSEQLLCISCRARRRKVFVLIDWAALASVRRI